jgi:WD40 repeat protein
MSDVKVNQLKCKASASLLPNNLSSSEGFLTYIHRSEVHLVKNVHTSLVSTEKGSSMSIKAAYAEKDPISHARFCHLQMGDVQLVATLTGLIHVYDSDGQKLLHFHKLANTSDLAKEAQLRGIAHDGAAYVTIGSGKGDLLVFNITQKKLSLTRKLTGHKDGITDLDLNLKENLLASADEAGNIALWSTKEAKEGAYTKIADFKGTGDPCWSVQIGHGYVIGGYSTGHIRMFSLEKKQLSVEIAAHTRTINAIDIHPSLPMVIACSEDTYLSAWSIPATKGAQVKNLSMISTNSSLLTGCRFCGKDKTLVAVTAYDSRFLAVLPVPKLS